MCRVSVLLCAADFGFARFLQDGVMAATLCGSPMYMVCVPHRHRIDKYLDTLLAMKSEATAIFLPQDGRWKITVSFDGRRFCLPKFRH